MLDGIRDFVSDRVDDVRDIDLPNPLNGARDIHNHLLDESPEYRLLDGVVHDGKHAIMEVASGSNPIIELGQFGASALIRTAQTGADRYDIQQGEHEVIRFEDLDQDTQGHINSVYGDSLETENIRIVVGGTSMDYLTAHAIGNTVYMPENTIVKNSNGQYETTDLELLTHEVGHSWQNQNGGGDYAPVALYEMANSFIRTTDVDVGINPAQPFGPPLPTPFIDVEWGSRTELAYRGPEEFDAGVPFEEMGVEDQATFIEKVLSPKIENGTPLTPEEQTILDQIHAGEG